MEYKIKALKVSSIRGYIVVLEEYSLPEKYTTYRVHLHIPGIKQIFKDYPSTAISAADRYSNFNDDYKQILDTYEDWVEHVLDRVYPISNSAYETKYPKPNYFYIRLGTDEFKYPVDDWDKDLPISMINSNNYYKNIGIRFTREINDNVLHIAYVEMPIMR